MPEDLNNVFVVEEGVEPRPARFKAFVAGMDCGKPVDRILVEFTDARGGSRTCLPRSVFRSLAEAKAADRC